MIVSGAGIYKITNLVTSKFYIGSSKNIKKRITHHKFALKNRKHGNEHLQRAWNKYGEESFRFEIIEVICDASRELLLEKEQKWLDELKPEYNILKIAGSGSGAKRTRESILKSQKTKYTWELINSIRNDFKNTTLSKVKLAKKYGISVHYMYHLLDNTRWYDENYDPKEIDEDCRRKLLGRRAINGKTHADSTLTEEDVVEIFRMNKIHGLPQNKIAEHYRICRGSIAKILQRKTFKYFQNQELFIELQEIIENADT